FLETMGAEMQVLRFGTANAAPSSTATEASAASPIAIEAAGALGVRGGCSGSAHFSAGVNRAVANGFGVHQGFGFSLGFFELSFFFGCLFHFFFSLRKFGRLRRNWLGGERNCFSSVVGRCGDVLRTVIARGVRFFFKFVEGSVFFELLDVGSDVGFFFVDFFFFDGAGGSG